MICDMQVAADAHCWLEILRVVPVCAARRDSGRDLPGTLNTNPFGTAALPGKQLDLAARNPEMFRKEANEMAVCLAIDGWCGQPDFQAIAVCAVKRVCRSPGLDMDG
jgi:hypothetical protein